MNICYERIHVRCGEECECQVGSSQQSVKVSVRNRYLRSGVVGGEKKTRTVGDRSVRRWRFARKRNTRGITFVAQRHYSLCFDRSFLRRSGPDIRDLLIPPHVDWVLTAGLIARQDSLRMLGGRLGPNV